MMTDKVHHFMTSELASRTGNRPSSPCGLPFHLNWCVHSHVLISGDIHAVPPATTLIHKRNIVSNPINRLIFMYGPYWESTIIVGPLAWAAAAISPASGRHSRITRPRSSGI
eukprot:9490523-Pyramimonas_sp.AAC.1